MPAVHRSRTAIFGRYRKELRRYWPHLPYLSQQFGLIHLFYSSTWVMTDLKLA